MSKFFRHRPQVFNQLQIRLMHVDMVARENTPIDLLAVVIEMVIAVPGASDISIRPVSEQARSGLMLSQATCKEVLVVIPGAFEFLVEKIHRGSGPEFSPVHFGSVHQILE